MLIFDYKRMLPGGQGAARRVDGLILPGSIWCFSGCGLAEASLWMVRPVSGRVAGGRGEEG